MVVVEFVIIVVKIIYINTLIPMKIDFYSEEIDSIQTESGGGSDNKKKEIIN